MATLEQNLVEWSLMEAYSLEDVTYLSGTDALLRTANIVWPDDSPGILTTLTFAIIDHQYVSLSRELTHEHSHLIILEAPPSLDERGRVLVDRGMQVINNLSAFGVAPLGLRPFGA